MRLNPAVGAGVVALLVAAGCGPGEVGDGVGDGETDSGETDSGETDETGESGESDTGGVDPDLPPEVELGPTRLVVQLGEDTVDFGDGYDEKGVLLVDVASSDADPVVHDLGFLELVYVSTAGDFVLVEGTSGPNQAVFQVPIEEDGPGDPVLLGEFPLNSTSRHDHVTPNEEWLVHWQHYEDLPAEVWYVSLTDPQLAPIPTLDGVTPQFSWHPDGERVFYPRRQGQDESRMEVQTIGDPNSSQLIYDYQPLVNTRAEISSDGELLFVNAWTFTNGLYVVPVDDAPVVAPTLIDSAMTGGVELRAYDPTTRRAIYASKDGTNARSVHIDEAGVVGPHAPMPANAASALMLEGGDDVLVRNPLGLYVIALSDLPDAEAHHVLGAATHPGLIDSASSMGWYAGDFLIALGTLGNQSPRVFGIDLSGDVPAVGVLCSEDSDDEALPYGAFGDWAVYASGVSVRRCDPSDPGVGTELFRAVDSLAGVTIGNSGDIYAGEATGDESSLWRGHVDHPGARQLLLEGEEGDRMYVFEL